MLDVLGDWILLYEPWGLYHTKSHSLFYTSFKTAVENNEGSLVEIGGNSLLTHIAQINPAYVNFSISEAEQNHRNQEE